MPRIPAELIESIKRDVPCRSVLEGAGAVFQSHGADVVCRCPFHDDQTPSLVVHERKNLWRCHGACGIGGDVIALTVKLRGVSFRHAVELLAAGLPAGAGGEGGAFSFAAGVPKTSTVRVLPCPLDATADDARLMVQVVDYYAARLALPGCAGRAYLAERGLDDGELIRRFAFGFADRSLGLRLPTKQRKEGAELRGRLAKLGVFRAESGHEHFSGSLVVPIHGGAWMGAAAGAVVGMYGRKTLDNLRSGTPKHLYLPGEHRGVWNCGPDLCDGNGAVIICEALLDAASCWVAGLRNVTATYGVNGWTEDHARALAEVPARDVFIAYDADAAGDAGAERLADVLIARGFTAYRVLLPPGQDINDVHRAAGSASGDELRRLVATAQWLGGVPRVTVPTGIPAAAGLPSSLPAGVAGVADAGGRVDAATAPMVPAMPAALPSGMTVQVAGEEITVEIGTRRYRVRGLFSNRGADAMRVNLRVAVERAGAAGNLAFHVDTLDLYQTRFRQAFTAAAAAECGLHPDVLKADLGKLLLALEIQRDERAGRNAAAGVAGVAGGNRPGESSAVVLTPDEEAAALALLKAPDLLGRIGADLTRCGLVGEDINKVVAYLAATSRRLDTPLAIVVQSSSAAGKSTLMDKVLSLMPPEEVRQYSAISGKSPFYLGTANLKHRILAVAEEEGARRASYALKLLQSDGHLSMAATGKNAETGRMETHDYRVEGPVMLMLTTTAIDVDPELLNRCLVLTVDEEAGQTAAIQASQREARTLAGMQAKRERSAIEALHRNAQRLLKPVAVVNPQAPALSFSAHQTRLRRDHAKYLALIDAVTFLHQYQRERKTATFPDGTILEYIEATAADIAMADQLAAVVLGWSVDELPPQSRRLLDAVRAHVVAEARRQGMPAARVTFDRRGLASAIGWTYKQVRTHLDRLAEDEFVVVGGMGFGQVLRYRLAVPEDAGPSGLGLRPQASASVPVPTATTNTLPTDAGACPSLARGLPVGDGQGESVGNSRSGGEKSGGLPMVPVFTTGGVQAVASYLGTDARCDPVAQFGQAG
jgi:DNA primase